MRQSLSKALYLSVSGIILGMGVVLPVEDPVPGKLKPVNGKIKKPGYRQVFGDGIKRAVPAQECVEI